MTQLLRVQNFMLSADGFGAGDGQSLERPFGHADPGAMTRVGGRHRELAEPHRPGRHPRARRLLHPRLHQQHRRRDHGAQQVRPAAAARGPTTSGRAGGATTRRSTRRCSCSPTTPARPSRCPTRRSTSSTPRPAEALQLGQGRRRRQGRAARWRRRDGPRVPRRRPRRHHARRRRARSSSGDGERLWNSPDELLDRFHLEVIPSPSGVTHHLFWRR